MRIAVEEAFITQELLSALTSRVSRVNARRDCAFKSIYGRLLLADQMAKIREKLLDVDGDRLADMETNNVDVQVLSITAPGVQALKKTKACRLAEQSNAWLAKVAESHNGRYYGLICVYPGDVKAALKEIERYANVERMVGIIINSHTKGEYLDHEKYYPIFEAAEDQRLPIYLHPSTPSPKMAAPYVKYGLEGPIWGFAAETGLHAMRLVLGGLFDRFEKLTMILGHLGEGIPYWLHRLDSRIGLSEAFDHTGCVRRLKKLPSEYFTNNFYFSTSGMNEERVVNYVRSVCGDDRLLFAIDYPYESSADAVEGIERSNFSNEFKSKLYSLNAERAFGRVFSVSA